MHQCKKYRTFFNNIKSPTGCPWIFLLPFYLSCGESGTVIRSLNADEFISKIVSEPGIVIDVRTPSEWRSGIFRDAVLLDYSGGQFQTSIKTLHRGATYYIYCHSGVRSASAAKWMVRNGFTKVYNVEDGFHRLRAMGIPTSLP